MFVAPATRWAPDDAVMELGALSPGRRPGVQVAGLASTLIFAATVSGCAAVGPNFKPPVATTAQTYAGAGDKAAALAVLTSNARDAGPWWLALGSPALDEVMTRALANNQTVAAAQATLEKAQAQAQKERAALAPSVTGAAAYNRERINITALGFPGFANPTIGLYSIGPSVTYDLDLVGGQRRRVEAARAMVQVEAGKADAAYLALTGNVALEAVKIAAYRAQLEVIQGVVDDDRTSIEIVRKAEAAGGASPSAALGGHLQLQQDLALLPPVEQNLAEAKHALAMLVGEAPSGWSAPDFDVQDFIPPSPIPVALPSALVHHRPDIQAAEAQLHADTAIIGFESARLYPDIRLTASITQEALTPSALFDFGATAYSLGPSLTMPIFDGGAIRADRRAAQAQARASLAQYRQTVISAFVQVADVLSALGQDQERLAMLDMAESTAKASLDDAKAAYGLGGGPLASVIIADRQWREASLAQVGAVGQRLGDIVALYAATATDWRSTPNSAALMSSDQVNGVKRLASPRQSP